jgi:hypothetical protein
MSFPQGAATLWSRERARGSWFARKVGVARQIGGQAALDRSGSPFDA